MRWPGKHQKQLEVPCILPLFAQKLAVPPSCLRVRGNPYGWKQKPMLMPETPNAGTCALTQPSPAHSRHTQSITALSVLPLAWAAVSHFRDFQARMVVIAFPINKQFLFEKGGGKKMHITIKTCTTALCKYLGPQGLHLNSLIISSFYLRINNKYIPNY